MIEYTKDMMAATMLTHQISSMLGICVNRSCMAPKMIMYLRPSKAESNPCSVAWVQGISSTYLLMAGLHSVSEPMAAGLTCCRHM